MVSEVFERYRLATKLNKDDGEVQVSCPFYTMGNEAENIHKSFTFTEEENRNDFAIVIGKFDEYFFLQVDSIPVEFKIDTAADITVISEDTFHTLTPERTPLPSEIPLDSPGGELLCLGRFTATVRHKEKDFPFTVYIVRGCRVNNQLSQTLSVRMNLVGQVDEVKPSICHLQAYSEHVKVLRRGPKRKTVVWAEKGFIREGEKK